MSKLKKLPNSYFFSKEAGSIRGISDIVGCVNGRFIALECKRSLDDYNKYHPRTALQKKFIDDINKCGGYAAFVYPENEDEVLNVLFSL